MNKNDILLRNATTNHSRVMSLRKIVFTKFNAACGVRVRRVAACGCKMRFSTFLCFKKFCIRHVIYQNSAFFKLYTMVSVSALIGSKKMCPKIVLLGMYEIFRKNGGHCTRNFWPQGPVPRENQVWKMCTKSWNFEIFFP